MKEKVKNKGGIRVKKLKSRIDVLPIPVWEEDLSLVAGRFQTLRDSGVEDLRAYLEEHPEETRNLASLVCIIDINPASLEYFNVKKKEDLLGSLEKYLIEDSYAVLQDEMVALFEGKTRFSAEIAIHPPVIEERRVVSFHLAIAAGFEKSLERVIVSFIDITERIEAEEKRFQSEQKFRLMADGLPHMIWVVDAAGNQKFVNLTYCHFFGVTVDQVLNQRWRPLVHPDDAAAYTGKFDSCVREKKSFHAVCRVRRADGQWRWIESYGQPRFSPEGDFLGIVGTSPDITDRKEGEIKLQRYRSDLKARVALRTEELQRRAHQLAHLSSELILAEQRERRRMATVIHDNLQQIMTATRFRMEKLCSRAGLELKSEIEQIKKMIDEMISISRSLTSDLSPPVLNESGLIPGLEWLSRRVKEQYGLTVEFRSDTENLGEPEDIRFLLFQSVQELLINAAKHSDVSKADVDLKRLDDDCIALTVKDGGKGFDLKIVENAPSQLKGGFGLFSIRERLELIGGRLEIDSAPGEGARFTLVAPVRIPIPEETVPKDPSEETDIFASAPAGAKNEEAKTIRILLADDHSMFREGLSMLLEGHEGLEVIGEAVNGEEAVEMARQLNPDVILMDYSMPKMDGLEATRIIHSEMPHIRIIGLSMYEESDRAQEMRQAGATAYASKVGPSDTLLSTILNIPVEK